MCIGKRRPSRTREAPDLDGSIERKQAVFVTGSCAVRPLPKRGRVLHMSILVLRRLRGNALGARTTPEKSGA